MGMVVQHNMNALNAYNKLNTNVAGLKKSSEKLSSGYRINRAGDDAAGLAISEKMRSQIRGLTQAKRNSQDGISMIQTFEGATNESHSILQRMKELAAESANGTYQNEVDRDAIQLEYNQLNDELDQIADTDFNGVVMLNGGTMADGTKAVAGKFDYTDNTSVRDAVKLSSSDFNVGTAKGKVTADETVTFTYTKNADGTGKWTQKGGTAANFTAGNTDSTGGFTYDGYVFSTDTSKLVSGDSVTIDFSKGSDEITQAAKTAGYSFTGFTKDPIGDVTAADVAPTTKADADLINKLQGAVINLTTDANGKVLAADAGKVSMTLTDGTKVTGAATSATNPYSIAVEENGAITIKGWVNGADTTLFSIAAGTANADNASTNGTITLAFAEAVYQPADLGGYKINGAAAKVSEANSNGTATAPLTYSDHMVLQTGSRTKDSVDFTFNYSTNGMGDLKSNLDLSSRANGLNTKNLSLATQEDANNAIDKIDNAINKVSMVRATFGATQNRLEHKIENLTTNTENLTEAESTIRDTDMASEMLNYTKFNVLQQAAQSMLAQANQQPQSILQLLG